MAAYYNEIEPFKADYLRVLIQQRVIAPGEVDERSIKEVNPGDLAGFTQCHFFAGIGVWSYALRLAGWDDSRPVWTGSCPCPGFSAAGKGGGFDDPRHLWPDWYRLIRECRPATVFGEQVDAAIGHGWLDLVQTDLEGEAYSVGKAVLGACSAGAPHKRQRLYFVADSEHSERREIVLDGEDGCDGPNDGRQEAHGIAGARGQVRDGSDPDGRLSGDGGIQCGGEQRLLAQDGGTGDGSQSEQPGLEGYSGDERDGHRPGWLDPVAARSVAAAGATGGFWRDCAWWYGRDGKYRPIESGLFPLAHGIAGRVGLLRAYGDCIVPEVAQAFIESYCEAAQ